MKSAFSFFPGWPLTPDAIFWAGLALLAAGLVGELCYRAWHLPRISGYAVIGLISRTSDVVEYYVAGRRVPAFFNGLVLGIAALGILTGYITCTVTRVLPNGNLYIRGEKWIGINQGSEYVRLGGVVRPIDIAPDNSVPSLKVGAANISYGGKGALADANNQGWLSRFFNSPWTPF